MSKFPRFTGSSKFKACPHKIPTISEVDATFTCPVTDQRGIVVRVEPCGTRGLGKDTGRYEDTKTALERLGEAAGAMVCGSCVFYRRSSAEVSTALAAEYNAEARLLAARAERAQQELAYRKAQAELLEAFPPTEIVGLPPMPESLSENLGQ